ncbi:hypothetical protein C8R43DRAFT_1163358 [Mycena crocata]|nr:hypothetical protein C8R43DRAFT_1163358 [Mycena crocata]
MKFITIVHVLSALILASVATTADAAVLRGASARGIPGDVTSSDGGRADVFEPIDLNNVEVDISVHYNLRELKPINKTSESVGTNKEARPDGPDDGLGTARGVKVDDLVIQLLNKREVTGHKSTVTASFVGTLAQWLEHLK